MLSFAVAGLLADAGWSEAVAECAFVLHVASPFPSGVPKHEDELIIPAREGDLRVLTAARDALVRRVVLTSSFASIGYGKKPTDQPFTDEDWTDAATSGLSAYVKSKTLGELAAWDFMAREGGALELAAVNPVGIFGPVLGPDFSSSIQLLQTLMNGGMPRTPRLTFGVVDVRDVADLHLRAMINPAAKGQRFLAVAGDSMSMQQMSLLLKARMGDSARRAPTKVMPDWIVRLIAMFNPALAQAVPELGKVKKFSNAKAKRLLGWAPRSNVEAIIASGQSLVRFGLLKTDPKKQASLGS